MERYLFGCSLDICGCCGGDTLLARRGAHVRGFAVGALQVVRTLRSSFGELGAALISGDFDFIRQRLSNIVLIDLDVLFPLPEVWTSAKRGLLQCSPFASSRFVVSVPG